MSRQVGALGGALSGAGASRTTQREVLRAHGQYQAPSAVRALAQAQGSQLHAGRAAPAAKTQQKKPLKGGEFNFFGSTFEIPDLKLPQGSKITEVKSNGAGGHGIAERHRAPVI